MKDYKEFLKSKEIHFSHSGFDVSEKSLNRKARYFSDFIRNKDWFYGI